MSIVFHDYSFKGKVVFDTMKIYNASKSWCWFLFLWNLEKFSGRLFCKTLVSGWIWGLKFLRSSQPRVRSIHRRFSVRKVSLKNFTNFNTVLETFLNQVIDRPDQYQQSIKKIIDNNTLIKNKLVSNWYL